MERAAFLSGQTAAQDFVFRGFVRRAMQEWDGQSSARYAAPQHEINRVAPFNPVLPASFTPTIA
jgi:hypothetical protein